MPELPEVQTIINTLKDSGLINKQIMDVIVYKSKLLKNSNINSFKNFLINEKIKDITRIGKYIIFHLSNDKVLVSHLRMEGKFFYLSLHDKTYPKTHLRISFLLNDKRCLNYYDSRMFGTFHIHMENEYLKKEYLSKIALDPLDNDFDTNYLFNKINYLTKPIKSILLDQTIVSGIGNIYADEILFACNIHPLKKANSLNKKQIALIIKHAKLILKLSIKNKGTTIDSYKWNPKNHGGFQQFLKVHTKNNEFCPKCHKKISKIKVNGRGTYFCPICQKLN